MTVIRAAEGWQICHWRKLVIGAQILLFDFQKVVGKFVAIQLQFGLQYFVPDELPCDLFVVSRQIELITWSDGSFTR